MGLATGKGLDGKGKGKGAARAWVKAWGSGQTISIRTI